MTDMFDRAQELELRQREEALVRQAAKLSTGAGLSHCMDCGEAIPEKRRQCTPGCKRCVTCQHDYEERNAR